MSRPSFTALGYTRGVASLVPALDGRPIVLASGSPRRSELLARLGLDFTVVAPDIDETPLPGEPAAVLVVRLAAAKAAAVVADHPGAVVVAADTAVVVDGLTLGKPFGADDARRMLRTLSGRSHTVHTGVAVCAADGEVQTASSVSTVTFAALGSDEIEWYLATGEPFDKAGAYALQGAGGAFVEGVDGSVSGVLGLPLAATVRLLRSVSACTP